MLTRVEAETAILVKLHEIRAIMAEYTDRDNLLLCVMKGGGYSMWNCAMDETNGVLDCTEIDGAYHQLNHGTEEQDA